MSKPEAQKRCHRNRNRSKRRQIYCPEHGCYLDSASRKYWLYTESPEQLRQRGVSRRVALMLIATETAVKLDNEWIEGFWCPECGAVSWYHVCLVDQQDYRISTVERGLWEQAVGVIHPEGNPSVGAFTRRQSRANNYGCIKDFRFVV
jgi:hypothetical protein